jgi:hypothetical protein
MNSPKQSHSFVFRLLDNSSANESSQAKAVRKLHRARARVNIQDIAQLSSIRSF